MTTQTVVIVSADEVRAVRWTWALRSRGFLTERGPIDSLRQALAAEGPVVVVIDGVPPAHDLRSIAEATSAGAGTAVLIVGPVEPNIHAMVAIATGALGYLATCSSVESVVDAVDALTMGEAVLPCAVSIPLVRHLRCGGRGLEISGLDGRRAMLTGREWEVMVLLRHGLTTTQIARQLFVSAGTIRTHVAALVRKLGAADREALVEVPTNVR